MYHLEFDETEKSFIPKEQKKDFVHTIKNFHKLPERAQDLFLEIIFGLEAEEGKFDDFSFVTKIIGIPNYIDKCKSPIEIILFYALDILFIQLSSDMFIRFIPQYELNINGKVRIMDICVIEVDEYDNEIKPLFFIECDGYEYHASTKEQFTKTNQRDRELKIAGYDVLHFSGSEIYKNPFDCAYQIIDYIKDRFENG